MYIVLGKMPIVFGSSPKSDMAAVANTKWPQRFKMAAKNLFMKFNETQENLKKVQKNKSAKTQNGCQNAKHNMIVALVRVLKYLFTVQV
jgi:hypothetical protein